MKRTLEKICIICNNTFKTKNNRRKTCSTKCSHQHQKECVKEYQKTDKYKQYQKEYYQHKKKENKK